MDGNLNRIKTKVYDKSLLQISSFRMEAESSDYYACRFKLNGLYIICRNAKTTPKKLGQFVTFWKRDSKSLIEPLHEYDPIDFFVVNAKAENTLGQFVFPKAILIKKGIISTDHKDGKRAFRVYPKWGLPKSKQAERTQKWQLEYFYEVNNSTDLNKVADLYKSNH
jgi:hypothetical protein